MQTRSFLERMSIKLYLTYKLYIIIRTIFLPSTSNIVRTRNNFESDMPAPYDRLTHLRLENLKNISFPPQKNRSSSVHNHQIHFPMWLWLCFYRLIYHCKPKKLVEFVCCMYVWKLRTDRSPTEPFQSLPPYEPQFVLFAFYHAKLLKLTNRLK